MHPNKHALLFLLLLFTSLLPAQVNEVSGRISIHNSKEKNKVIQYVNDVKISTSLTEPILSDYKGRFKLKFPSTTSNQEVILEIEKTGFEVVNQNTLKHFNSNRKSLMRIFLAENGYLEKQRKKLFYSNQKALYAHRDHLLDLLAFDNNESKNIIQELEEQLNLKIYNRIEAEEKVNIEVTNIEKKLEPFSSYLATVNLDFASSMFQKGFDFYQKGDLEKTVTSLDERTLEKNFNNIIAVIEKAKETPEKMNKVMSIRLIQLNQIKESLILKTIALQQLFRYQDAELVLKKLSKVIAITEFGEDKEVFNLLKLSNDIDNSTIQVEPKLAVTEEFLSKETPIEIIEKEEIKEQVELVSSYESNINLDSTQSTSGKLSTNDYETALLLKSKKRIVKEEIITKEEEVIIEPQKEIVKSQPIIIENPKLIVESKPVRVIKPDPIITPVKKQEVFVAKSPVVSYDSFSITKKTSLRTLPTSSSKVLKRLKIGTKVEVIERIDQYWSKVIYNGKEGYVKALLLEKVN